MSLGASVEYLIRKRTITTLKKAVVFLCQNLIMRLFWWKFMAIRLFFGSGPGFVNRMQSDPGFVNPVRAGPGFVNPIPSGPVRVLSTPHRKSRKRKNQNYNCDCVTCCVTCPYLSNPYLEIPGCLRSVVPAI